MPRSALQILITALAGLALSGCVTESRPLFGAGALPEQAVQDYLQLAQRYFGQGDLVNTRRHLDNLLALDPDNSEAYGVRGLLHAREGDLDLAEQHFRRAIRLDTDNSQARNNYAAFLFAQGRYDEAHAQLETVVRDTAYHGRPQAFENLGLAALRLERRAQAEQAFQRALQLNPELPRSSLELADLSLLGGEPARARDFYAGYQRVSQLQQLEPSPRSLWVGWRLERALGNGSGAGAYARLLEERHPTSTEYQLYLQSRND